MPGTDLLSGAPDPDVAFDTDIDVAFDTDVDVTDVDTGPVLDARRQAAGRLLRALHTDVTDVDTDTVPGLDDEAAAAVAFILSDRLQQLATADVQIAEAKVLLNEMTQHMSLRESKVQAYKQTQEHKLTLKEHEQALKEHEQVLEDSHATMNGYARKLVQDYGWTLSQISEATGIPHKTRPKH
jgi:hypothetical protein